MRYINFAMAKGRLTEKSLDLLEYAGYDCSEIRCASRKLIIEDEANKARFFLVKPADVPTYVEYGAADVGIVGKDTIMEEGRRLYEVLDLGFAKCRMVVAGPEKYMGKLGQLHNKRVATKYPQIARDYFENKRRESIEIIRLSGSVELAPLVGLAELIVDLVETGTTLKENGLVVLDEIAPISARLIVNRVSMKMESERINKLIKSFKEKLDKSND
jgi:ATP phosphoribosyltransferase